MNPRATPGADPEHDAQGRASRATDGVLPGRFSETDALAETVHRGPASAVAQTDIANMVSAPVGHEMI
jgi:hypothetical protein